MRAAAAALLVATGCATAAPPAATTPPTWERPGLAGSVRPEMGSPQPGEAAPDFDLPDLDGKATKLSSLRGSWVLLHFTATWCPYCDAEFAHLRELADAFAPRGLRVVVVDVEEQAAAWKAYAAPRISPNELALLDTSGAAAARFAPPRAQPSFEDRAQAVLDGTLLLDPRGAIRLFLLPDSAHFDPTFTAVRAEIDRLVPAPTVAVRAAATHATRGTSAIAEVTLDVAPGFHVMSDRPSEPTYIATRVALDAEQGVAAGDVRYPAATPYALGEKTIATFAGAVTVQVPLTIANDAAPGARRLRGQVRYQACTESRCLFPTTRAFELPLVVEP